MQYFSNIKLHIQAYVKKDAYIRRYFRNSMSDKSRTRSNQRCNYEI